MKKLKVSKRLVAICTSCLGLLSCGKSFAMNGRNKDSYDSSTVKRYLSVVDSDESKQRHLLKCQDVKKAFEESTNMHCDKVLGCGNSGIIFTVKENKNILVKFVPRFTGAAKMFHVVLEGNGKKFSPEARYLKYHKEGNQLGKNVCKVFKYGFAHTKKDDDYDMWYIMEKVKGEELNKYAYKHGCTCAQIINWAIGIIDGLENLHNDGWVHNDMRIDNIMIREKDNSAVIVDLGNLIDINNLRKCGKEAGASSQEKDDYMGFYKIILDLVRNVRDEDKKLNSLVYKKLSTGKYIGETPEETKNKLNELKSQLHHILYHANS